MLDLAWSEILLVAVVALVVIGPKDLPLAMRTAGRWIGKMRRISGHFRSGIETMIREAELEEMERKWREQNERIMADHPGNEMQPLPAPADDVPPASSEARRPPPAPDAPLETPPKTPNAEEPQLPLGGPVSRHEP